jgi:hypothetical protein
MSAPTFKFLLGSILLMFVSLFLSYPGYASSDYEKVIIQMEQSEYWKQLYPERVLEHREKLVELQEQAAEGNP